MKCQNLVLQRFLGTEIYFCKLEVSFPIQPFEEYLLHPDEKKALLPVFAIYGANAAGKSNVLHEMMTMKEMVVGNAAKVSKG